jgi:hypothetical protein
MSNLKALQVWEENESMRETTTVIPKHTGPRRE